MQVMVKIICNFAISPTVFPKTFMKFNKEIDSELEARVNLDKHE